MFGRKKKVEEEQVAVQSDIANEPPIDQVPFWQAIWPVLACGAGLFSDGYVNSVIGSVTTTLGYQYGTVYSGSNAAKILGAIAFAGTVSPCPHREDIAADLHPGSLRTRSWVNCSLAFSPIDGLALALFLCLPSS